MEEIKITDQSKSTDYTKHPLGTEATDLDTSDQAAVTCNLPNNDDPIEKDACSVSLKEYSDLWDPTVSPLMVVVLPSEETVQKVYSAIWCYPGNNTIISMLTHPVNHRDNHRTHRGPNLYNKTKCVCSMDEESYCERKNTVDMGTEEATTSIGESLKTSDTKHTGNVAKTVCQHPWATNTETHLANLEDHKHSYERGVDHAMAPQEMHNLDKHVISYSVGYKCTPLHCPHLQEWVTSGGTCGAGPVVSPGSDDHQKDVSVMGTYVRSTQCKHLYVETLSLRLCSRLTTNNDKTNLKDADEWKSMQTTRVHCSPTFHVRTAALSCESVCHCNVTTKTVVIKALVSARAGTGGYSENDGLETGDEQPETIDGWLPDQTHLDTKSTGSQFAISEHTHPQIIQRNLPLTSQNVHDKNGLGFNLF